MQVPAQSRGRGLRRDFEYEEFRVIVEVDGRLGHVGAGMFADRRRDRSALREGRISIRAGWVDVAHDTCELALDVGLTLRTRGWTGRIRGCSPGCPGEDPGRKKVP